MQFEAADDKAEQFSGMYNLLKEEIVDLDVYFCFFASSRSFWLWTGEHNFLHRSSIGLLMVGYLLTSCVSTCRSQFEEPLAMEVRGEWRAYSVHKSQHQCVNRGDD